MTLLASFLTAAALALGHAFSNRLRLLDGVPRSRLLSIAGGMSVAFIFLRILPGLGEGQEAIASAAQSGALRFLHHHAYIVALLNLTLFHAVERGCRRPASASNRPGKESGPAIASSGCTWRCTPWTTC